MKVGEAIDKLKEKANDPELDFEIESDPFTGRVRLIKIRKVRNILTNWVTPAALGQYIESRLEDKHRDI